MLPPTDTPLVARLARWLDWWFTPRWRALLTWFALTAIAEAVTNVIANSWAWEELTGGPIDYLNRVLPAPLPPIFKSIAYHLSDWPLFVWFQPLALRLSLRRGLSWISILLVAMIANDFVYSSGYDSKWSWYGIDCGSAALQCCVFWKWRSRPWMCLLAWVATDALWTYSPLRDINLRHWLVVAVHLLPYAALLLYGTRLLRPEERARQN